MKGLESEPIITNSVTSLVKGSADVSRGKWRDVHLPPTAPEGIEEAETPRWNLSVKSTICSTAPAWQKHSWAISKDRPTVWLSTSGRRCTLFAWCASYMPGLTGTEAGFQWQLSLTDEHFWLASKGSFCESLWKHLNMFHLLAPVSTVLSGAIQSGPSLCSRLKACL